MNILQQAKQERLEILNSYDGLVAELNAKKEERDLVVEKLNAEISDLELKIENCGDLSKVREEFEEIQEYLYLLQIEARPVAVAVAEEVVVEENVSCETLEENTTVNP